MSFSEEGYLQILDDWIQDEDKVITYRHLSLALGVPCSQAKSMLASYARKLRSAETSHLVHLVYLVTGNLSEEEIVVKLVPEEFLESTKSQLSTITSIHVYSISKSDIRNPFLLQKASTLIQENISEILKYSQITNSHIQRKTLKYKSATHMNAPQPKIAKLDPTPMEHPNDSKSESLKATHTPSENSNSLNNPPNKNLGKPSSANSRTKKTQNKLHFSNSVKNTNIKKVNRLDEGVKRIQINKPSTPSEDDSTSSESDMDLGPRRYFPPSLPQEVMESHVDRPKLTGFLEDDSDEEFLRTDPSVPLIEETPRPSQVGMLSVSDIFLLQLYLYFKYSGTSIIRH